MKILVTSLRRLLIAGKITKSKVQDYLANGKINDTEYNYITNEVIND